jgi:WD40 repeat protein
MRIHRLYFAAALLLTTTPLAAGKPGSTTFDPEIAYTILTGSTELRVTDATGSKSATLYSVRENINIDVAPRSQHQVAISEINTLKLLTYASDSTGVRTTSIDSIYSGGSERVDRVDFSPDGSKVAFAQGATKLMVLDLTQPLGSGNPLQWAQDPIFVGELTWYKGGTAIAYVDGNANVLEVSGPGATPTLLLHEPNIDLIDASRTDPDALLVTYNRPGPQGPKAGLWKAGAYINETLTGSTFTDFATLSCDDTKLVYGTPDTKGQLIWRIRDLTSGADTLYTKTLRVRQTQFVPTCAAATNNALDFRIVPH